MAKADLTPERLREVLNYNPETGVFTWRVRMGNRRAGEVAGSINTQGYVQLRVDRRQGLAHRLSWLHVYGHWPAHQIDHINGDRADNRICNLRDATRAENSQNMRSPHKDSVSKYLGVTWHKACRKWWARICIDGRRISLGYFDTESDAADAYVAAKRELHPFVTI